MTGKLLRPLSVVLLLVVGINKAMANPIPFYFPPRTRGLHITIKFDANGGTVNEGEKVVEGMYNSKLGVLPNAERIGYAFTGWYTKAVGGSNVSGLMTLEDLENCYLDGIVLDYLHREKSSEPLGWNEYANGHYSCVLYAHWSLGANDNDSCWYNPFEPFNYYNSTRWLYRLERRVLPVIQSAKRLLPVIQSAKRKI